MAPKALLEKKAWGWITQVCPDDVQREQIVSAYRLNIPPCKPGSCKRNCRGNPNCLQGLGERYWFSEVSDSTLSDVTEPESERREKDKCVGLRNLGATCYYNTLLQVWFHDSLFRTTLYKWQEDEDPQVCMARRKQREAAERQDDDDDDDCAVIATVAESTEGMNEVSSTDEQEQEQLDRAIAASLEYLPSSSSSSKRRSEYAGMVDDTACSVSKVVPAKSDPSDPLLKSVCGQLRLIFAKLQLSNRRYIDTVDFSNTLGLNTSQQQDAQEFCHLFISLLQTQLQSQSDETVKQFVEKQFVGKLAYVTTCSTCSVSNEKKETFYQLNISIQQSDSNLQDGLQHYLEEEFLEGDNQYLCSMCALKRDSARRIELRALPPVLNFQLMRFVFDRNTNNKKKSKAWIHFPEELDMSAFVSDANAGDGSLMYDLTAVLIHCGPSAFAGHYVAHIRNSETKQWWQFNDEHSELLTGKVHLGLNKTDVAKLKGKRVPKGCHTSNDAYMLVYTRRTETPAQNLCLEPPACVMAAVEEDNEKLEDWITSAKCCQMESIESVRQKRMDKQNLYSLLNVTDADKDYRFVKTGWLHLWLDEENGDENMTELTDHGLGCIHGNLNVAKAESLKRISVLAADELLGIYGGSLRFGKDSLCTECVVLKCRHMRFASQLADDVRQVAALLKAKSSGAPGFWVGKLSLQRWRRLASEEFYARYPVPDTASPASDDSSPNGTPPPPPGGNGYEEDEEDGRAAAPEPSSPATNAAEMLDDVLGSGGNGAAAESVAESGTQRTTRSKATTRTRSDSSDGNGCERACQDQPMQDDTAVAEVTMAEATVEKAAQEQEQALALPGHGAEARFNEECVCVHDDFSADDSVRRLVSAQVWQILRKYFPSAAECPEQREVCAKCQESLLEERDNAAVMRGKAEEQKVLFSSLLLSRSLEPELQEEETSSVFYVVSGDFLDKLKRFIRSNGLSGAPEYIDNSGFLCPHKALLYDVVPTDDEDEQAESPKFSYLTEENWEMLNQLYDCCDVVSVRVTRAAHMSSSGGQEVVCASSPGLCTECYVARLAEDEKRRLQYHDATVYVRMVESNPNENDTDRRLGSASDGLDLEAPPSKRLCVEDGTAVGVRRSSRQRRSRNSFSICVSSDEPLMDLKVKLMRHFQAAPFDQHVAIEANGAFTELLDNQETLSAQGVVPNSSLVVWVDKPVSSEVDDIIPINTVPEEGFKGTALLSTL